MTAFVSATTRKSFSPLRRALLGAMFASVALPRLSFAQQKNNPASWEPTDMRIRLTFNNQSMIATLYDNPSARDLVSLLPLDLTIDNYANNEKIAYLPRKLTEEGSEPFGNEAPGDLCYYAPWGNLALFYAGYRWSEGVIRLGRLEGSFESLLTRGKFPLRVERIP
ncbi:MAG: cyclophilin-like fold protein [Microvirga sp.]